jgi:hypothetical protein
MQIGVARTVSPSGWIEQLAAPRWTVLFFLLTAAAALAIAQGGLPATPLMLAPFALLVLNLVAAIVGNARFRADLPLLVFHLALLALVALVALARLTYLDARTTLTRGTAFEGVPETRESGPLHWGRLDALRFTNAGLSARYSASGVYEGTYNRVRWQGADGRWQSAEIGDDRPLILDGYRIYATVHRGLAPLFRWQPAGGEAEMGSVQLDDHRNRVEGPPAAGWRLPGGPEVWVQLAFTPLPAPRGTSQEDLGAAELEHALVLRSGERRELIRAGDSVDFPQGWLTYVRLDSWMSYRIVYDPTTPWIIATVIVGIASLVWFYAGRIRGRPVPEGA